MNSRNYKTILDTFIIITTIIGVFIIAINSLSLINQKFHTFSYIVYELNLYVFKAAKLFLVLLSVTIILVFIKLVSQPIKRE